jgi:hypothetical protein
MMGFHGRCDGIKYGDNLFDMIIIIGNILIIMGILSDGEKVPSGKPLHNYGTSPCY